jgi:hypothetical protein
MTYTFDETLNHEQAVERQYSPLNQAMRELVHNPASTWYNLFSNLAIIRY